MNRDQPDFPNAPAADGWKVLAGARFALAFVVVCGHLFRFVQPDQIGNKVFLELGSFGAVAAVFGFLVISGFSIAHSITTQPHGFYRRRAWRIYPLYVCGILASLIPFAFVGSRIETFNSQFLSPGLDTLAGNFVFLQGFLYRPLSTNAPLWTLSVEVFCYIFAPVFVRLHSGVLLALVGISAIAFGIFPRLGLPFYSGLLYGGPAVFLLWAWLGGFVFYSKRHAPAYQFALVGLGALLFSLNSVFNTKLAIFTFVASTLVVVYCDRLPLRGPALRVLNYLGELSYPLYVLHYPVLVIAYAVLQIRSAPMMILLTLLAAAIFYHAVDRPLRVRRRSQRAASSATTG